MPVLYLYLYFYFLLSLLSLAEKSEMVAGRDNPRRNRILPSICVAWLFAAILGDELVGVVLFGLESDALLMSLTQCWWWVYEGLLLALVCLTVLVVRGIGVFRAKRV